MKSANDIWLLYRAGRNYNDKLSLYSTVAENERFAAGEQWNGVDAGDIDLFTDNRFTRVIGQFTSTIVSKGIKFQFTPELLSYVENVPIITEGVTTPIDVPVADILNANVEHLWEKMRMDSSLRQGARDMIVTGDIAGFYRWNPKIPTGQAAKGDIDFEMLDNTDVYFGNPNDRRVNHRGMPVQPYIIIAAREEVYKLKQEAEENGVGKKERDSIIADTETLYRSGDRANIELDNMVAENEKACVLYYFYPHQDGNIHCVKSTAKVIIKPDWNIKSQIYPIVWNNWEARKNSYHGQALITNQKDNQVAINKAYTELLYSLKQATLSKIVYDKSVVPEWNDIIGEKVGINGTERPINEIVWQVPQPQMNSAFLGIASGAVGEFMDSIGATDALMGDVKAENTSAIIAVREASTVPLENPRANEFQFVEDGGYIILDMMANHYGIRKVPVYIEGKKEIIEFDFNKLKDMMFTIKVDVGDSNIWSETEAATTLSNMFTTGAIDALQLVESLPKGYIPNQQKLISEKRREKEAMAAMQQQMPLDSGISPDIGSVPQQPVY